MNRKNKAFLTSITSIINELTTVICGFILPRLFLQSYGSEVNGLISSITYFLNFITLAECGVGAVVQSNLYKPLAEKDFVGISKIYISSEKFFKKIAFILVGYTTLLIVIYPKIVGTSFDYLYVASMVFILSLSIFSQYFFGMSNRLLLGADQLGFINNTVKTVSLGLNTIICIIMIYRGCSIHIVKSVSAIIFFLQPIIFFIISKRKYPIKKNIKYDEEPIKQKWNGLAQHIASTVLNNTDTIVLTLFATLKLVSVYSVYNMVVSGIKQIIVSFTNGFQALFGNMLVNEEDEILNSSFNTFEWLIHTSTTLLFTVTSLLIIPFVSIYTNNINDTNYIVPNFAYVITFAQAVYCLRLPYSIIVLAACHYKQTQLSAVIEAIINIIISIVAVSKFGLVGVAIGTLIAMTFRTVYFAFYLQKNILYRKIHHFLKHIIIDIASASIMIFICNPINYSVNSYIEWFLLAMKISVICLIICLIINSITYRKVMKGVLKLLKR